MEILLSEDYELTPSIRSSVMTAIDKIRGHSRGELDLRVFLSKENLHFIVKFKFHLLGIDMFTVGKDEDFYKALSQAKVKALRVLNDSKKRRPRKGPSLKELEYVDHE